ncbi:MAG: hypothetical protein ACMXYM_03330 [Candidatus Woesearchaeota archaeon]
MVSREDVVAAFREDREDQYVLFLGLARTLSPHERMDLVEEIWEACPEQFENLESLTQKVFSDAAYSLSSGAKDSQEIDLDALYAEAKDSLEWLRSFEEKRKQRRDSRDASAGDARRSR